MYIPQAAQLIGITPRALRAYLRRTGRDQATKAGQRYSFTYAEVEDLSNVYWASRPSRPEPKEPIPGDDKQGLPIEALRDPSMREQFAALRRERNRRLDALLRERGASLPQMSEARLVGNGRALALTEQEVDA